MIIYIIVLVGVLIAGAAKYWRTRDLSAKLGREVEDHELVSLNSWMEAEKKAEKKRRAFKDKVVKYENEPAPLGTQTINNAANEQKIGAGDFQTPNNCLHCGAALSKEIPYCQFCGTHSSRKALEEHCAVFLLDLEKEYDNVIPSSYTHLRAGCFAIPVIAVVGSIIISATMKTAVSPCTLLIGVGAVSLVAAYLWNHFVDKTLSQKEKALFDHLIAAKVQRYIARNRLEPLEFMSIAKCHLEEKSGLLKQIHRRF